MLDKIEVFVKTEEVVVGQTVIGRPVADGAQVHWCTVKDTLKTEKFMPEADRAALEIANEVAREKGVKVEVIDVSTFMCRLKAKRAGVTKTPAIVMGGNKIDENLEKERILKLLQQLPCSTADRFSVDISNRNYSNTADVVKYNNILLAMIIETEG
ncbi:MAG: hypothetical protein QXX41_02225 [Nitrososphaerota archaeon]